MVERFTKEIDKREPNRRSGARQRDTQHDERYCGLSRAEVSLREKMAKRFGRAAQHLDATAANTQNNVKEESKQWAAPSLISAHS